LPLYPYFCAYLKFLPMIIDATSSFERYLKLHPRFEQAYRYIRNNDLAAMEPGKYPIEGEEIYCTISQGAGKALEEAPLEVHDSYIDVHILLSGEEVMGWRDRSRCHADDAVYDQERDIAFLSESPEVFISLTPEQFVIFFPHDAHAPMIGNGPIKKAIVKVLF